MISYLQKKADHQLEARIDVNDYDESQLMEIRVALNMPYQNNSSDFERQYGEIQIDGKYYTYVKSKVEDGYLVLQCIPNAAKQKIKSADNFLFSVNNGLDQEHNGKSNSPLNNVIKSIFNNYDNYSANYNFISFSASSNQFLSAGILFLKNASLPVSEQPPENFSSPLV